MLQNKIFVITSSGGLPQELSQEEFFEGISAPRNKELMRVFKDVKLVEQLGSGIQRILKGYDKNIFKFSMNFLKVSFPVINAGIILNLNNTQKSILKLIKQNKYITQGEMSVILNKNIRTIERNIKKLQIESVIERVGSNKDGYWNAID